MEKEKTFWGKIAQRLDVQNTDAVIKRSIEIFQIREYYGKLWFTYNGFPFCPCDMMKKEPLDALEELRDIYVKNHTKQ
jgi:hypothetical protein